MNEINIHTSKVSQQFDNFSCFSPTFAVVNLFGQNKPTTLVFRDFCRSLSSKQNINLALFVQFESKLHSGNKNCNLVLTSVCVSGWRIPTCRSWEKATKKRNQ